MATFAVIMAGGAGTRFWPASRLTKPKQFLALAGEEVLLKAAVRRLSSRIPADHVYIATGAHLLERTAALLPEVPRAQLLAEPAPRNTAPCVAWATATILRRDPDALIAVFPADPFIANEAPFVDAIDRAIHGATLDYITTIGIVPTRAETGYGYIEVGSEIEPGLATATRFVEKPNRERAELYFAGKKHLWNAGMFFFRGRSMLSAVSNHLPEVAAFLKQADAAAKDGREMELVVSEFPKLPSVSLDHGVMEKESRIAVVPGDFGWNDVGSWEAAWELAKQDTNGNALPSGSVAVDSSRNLVVDLTTSPNQKRIYALAGVHDLVVVETDDAVLVMPRERAQDVKTIVDVLREKGRTDVT